MSEFDQAAWRRGQALAMAADRRLAQRKAALDKKSAGGCGRGRSQNSGGGRACGRATRGQGSWVTRRRSPILLAQIHKGNIGGIKYGFKEKGAMNLDTNLLSNTAEDQHEEMALDARKHPRCKAENIFKHWSISLHPTLPGLSHAEWITIARAHLRKCGFAGCGYTVILHPKTDGHGEHIHIVASRSRPADGKLVSMSNDRWKFRAACREIEHEMNLQPVAVSADTPTPLAPTTRAVSAQRMAQRQGTQQEVWVRPETVLACLRDSTSTAQFEQRLAANGIQIQPAKRSSDGAVTGVLFRRDGSEIWLSGSTLSRSLSLPKVQAQIELNRQASLTQDRDLVMQRQREVIERQRLAQSQQVRPPRERY